MQPLPRGCRHVINHHAFGPRFPAIGGAPGFQIAVGARRHLRPHHGGDDDSRRSYRDPWPPVPAQRQHGRFGHFDGR